MQASIFLKLPFLIIYKKRIQNHFNLDVPGLAASVGRGPKENSLPCKIKWAFRSRSLFFQAAEGRGGSRPVVVVGPSAGVPLAHQVLLLGCRQEEDMRFRYTQQLLSLFLSAPPQGIFLSAYLLYIHASLMKRGSLLKSFNNLSEKLLVTKCSHPIAVQSQCSAELGSCCQVQRVLLPLWLMGQLLLCSTADIGRKAWSNAERVELLFPIL